jgi:hypothetical protein
MSKPYDAVTKRLLENRPEDWVALLGLPSGPASLVDADLSTVSVYADRLVRVDASVPYLMHNELESGNDSRDMPERLLHYNVNAYYKFRLPVLSTVFLLRKRGNSKRVTGELKLTGPDGRAYHTFAYRAVRVWELSPEPLLTGGLGTLPLAPIANVNQADLKRIVQRMQARIDAEAKSETEAAELWVATDILMGLRYNEAVTAPLFTRSTTNARFNFLSTNFTRRPRGRRRNRPTA